MTNEQNAAINEVKSAFDAMEALLSVRRELNSSLTQETVQALGLAMALEMQRIVDAQPFLPSASAEAA